MAIITYPCWGKYLPMLGLKLSHVVLSISSQIKYKSLIRIVIIITDTNMYTMACRHKKKITIQVYTCNGICSIEAKVLTGFSISWRSKCVSAVHGQEMTNAICRNLRLTSKQKRTLRTFVDQQQPNCRHPSSLIPLKLPGHMVRSCGFPAQTSLTESQTTAIYGPILWYDNIILL